MLHCDSFTAWEGVLGMWNSVSTFCSNCQCSGLCSTHIWQHTPSQQRMGGLKSNWNPPHLSTFLNCDCQKGLPKYILENWHHSPSRKSLYHLIYAIIFVVIALRWILFLKLLSFKIISYKLDVLAHSYSPSRGRWFCVSSRLAWSSKRVIGQPGLNRETLSQQTNKPTKQPTNQPSKIKQTNKQNQNN